jgi:Ca2+-binding RTX toxin-like protein
MAKITITADAGNYNINVEDISLDVGKGWTSLGKDVLKYGMSARNHIELTGSFTYKHGYTAEDVVKSVTGMKLVEHGDVVLQASGLDIVNADVRNGKTLASYFAGESYTIAGNNFNNTLVTADLADKLYGNGGIDKLYGNGGTDQLYGGAGNDRLNGGLGKDLLEGGSGVDTFIFAKGCGADTITDFNAVGKTHDVIDLSAYTGIDKFRELDISRVKHDVVIDLPGSDQITLKDVNIKDLDAGDFLF